MLTGDPLLPPDDACCCLIQQLEPAAVLAPLARFFRSRAAMPAGGIYATPDPAGMQDASHFLHSLRGRGEQCVLGIGLTGSQSQALAQQLAHLAMDIALVLVNLVATPAGELDTVALTTHGCSAWGARTMQTGATAHRPF